MTELNDVELLDYINCNPEQGLACLIQIYSGLVYSIVYGKLAIAYTTEDIEECVADIIYEFYKKREQVNLEKGSIKSFLCVMAKRRAIDVFRSKSSNLRSVPLDAVEQIYTLQDQTSDIIQKETSQYLLAAIKDLGHPDSEIFVRKFYLDQSSKEIAKHFNFRQNTVNKKISRGLAKLRKRLGGFVDDE